MKRVLNSILCAAGFIIGYFIFIVILNKLHPLSIHTLLTLLEPLDIPYRTYESFYGLHSDNKGLLHILNFTADILIYSIPFYLILTLFNKLKPKSNVQEIQNPPEPPIFDS